MSMVALVISLIPFGGTQYGINVAYVDPANSIYDQQRLLFTDQTAVDIPTILSDAQTAILNYASGASYSITASDIQWGTLGNSARSFTFPTRSLNSAFQVSVNRDSVVTYAVDVAATLSLTSGQAGTVTLEYGDDSGITTNVKTVQTAVNGNTGILAIGLNLVQTTTVTVTGMVPAGKYVRIRTTNTTGTPTFTYRTAQEVLL